MYLFWVWTFFLSLFWGGSYLAIRFALEAIPPYTGAAARIVVCILLSGLYLYVKTQPKVEWQWKLGAFVVGTCCKV